MGLLEKIFGNYSEKEIKKIKPIVSKIEALGPEYEKLSDEELRGKTQEFKDRLDVYKRQIMVPEEDLDEEPLYKIERIKHFEVKPMDAEEAVMEMELIGHNFFVFRNGETDEVNVVYKRKNGSYGLIEPEY